MQSAFIVLHVFMMKIKADFRKIGNTAPVFIVCKRIGRELYAFYVGTTKNVRTEISVADWQGISFPTIKAVFCRYVIF